MFCRIAAGEAEADVVHATDHVVAFRDINPRAPVHVLLIPREHIPSLRFVGEEHAGMLADLMVSAAHVARAEGSSNRGWRLVSNVGADGGQTVATCTSTCWAGGRCGGRPGEPAAGRRSNGQREPVAGGPPPPAL